MRTSKIDGIKIYRKAVPKMVHISNNLQLDDSNLQCFHSMLALFPTPTPIQKHKWGDLGHRKSQLCSVTAKCNSAVPLRTQIKEPGNCESSANG